MNTCIKVEKCTHHRAYQMFSLDSILLFNFYFSNVTVFCIEKIIIFAEDQIGQIWTRSHYVLNLGQYSGFPEISGGSVPFLLN